MNKILRYSFVALLAMIGLNISAQEVTIDFSGSEDVWGIGTTKLVATQSFTHNGITIKLTGTEGNGYRWYDSGNIILGKQGATLEFPAFNFDVARIDIEGTSGASAAVKQNIFVGEEAVSTETTGAKSVTNQYNIAEGKQAAGTIYTLKVTSAHNTQITKIMIYKKGSSAKDQAGISWSKASQTVTIGADDNIFPTLNNPNNLTVSYTSSKEEVATINANGEITLVGAGTTQISAIFEGNDTYEASTVSYSLTVKKAIDPNAKGQVNNPYTVAEALEVINALENGATTADKFYVKGFVVGTPDIQKKEDGTFYGNANFTIADTKGGTDLLTCYRLKGIDNANIESEDYIKEDDELVVMGQLQKYVSGETVTPEVKSGHIVSINVTPDPELPVVDVQPIYRFTANGQWASYTFNKANFKAAAITGFRIEYSDMTEVTEGAAFNILVNSAETHLGKDWAGNDAQVPNKTAYKNYGFDAAHTVFTGDFAEFVATDDPATTCPTIGQFALQACAAGNSVIIKKVVFIKADGTEILPEYKGDDWGGGGYTIEENPTGINNVNAAKAENAVRYNLAGQKVSNDYKGVVIENGKKVVVK
jgi:hypothetical protein